MAFDFIGFFVMVAVLTILAAVIYKKKFGKPISELWKNSGKKITDNIQPPSYQRMYITRGIKQ